MVSLDEKAFITRLEKFYKDWESIEEENDPWGEVDCVAVIVGKDDVLYAKSLAFQTWLFGYELVDTLCVFCGNDIHILSSKKKADFLRPLEAALKKKPDLPNLILHLRNKEDNDKENFKQIIDAAKTSKKGKKVGVFMKDLDSFSGDFINGWSKAMDNSKMKKVDISSAYALVSAPKDSNEIDIIKKACQVTCTIFSKQVRQEIATIVDDEKRVKHSKLADDIDSAVGNVKYMPQGMDKEQLEICYPPIIQSGGNYQLKFSTVSDDERLHFGTIICCFGVRYKSYCSNICRTMFVEPTKEMQGNYTFLLSVFEKVLSLLKDGAILSEIYTSAHEFVESERPDLVSHFTKTIGFATGLEFRESSLQLAPKCFAAAAKGMVINVNIGFSNLTNDSAEDERGKVYSLFIGDTVLVNEDGPATELTASSKKKISSIAIFLGEEEEEDETTDVTNNIFQGRGSRNTAVLDSRTRTEMGSEDKRKQHQAQLRKQINEEARKRMLEGLQDEVSKKPKLSSIIAYKHLSVLPLRENDVQNLKVFVDRKHESVILPVFGIPTPFHVSMIKNISKSEEGSHTYLRINLFYPGSTMGRTDGVTFPNPEATFVKELSFRGSNSGMSSEGLNLVSVYNLIKDVQKSFRTREQEKKELEGYKEQEQLVLSINKGNPRLKDLYIRPLLTSRRVLGVLEAHQNGLRYTTLKGDKVDIIYKNIKHAFFQPSKGEMIVLLHFHLKHPIIIGKKKHKDIQFYTEVGEIVADLGRSHHMHDRDDLMAEQAERELRQRLDNAFDNFRRKIEQMPQCNFDFEKPFRDLGFHGVPSRSTVLLTPTTNCLVHLTEPPSFVITLDEVELIHFERVQFHLKNFDMVFVFKDYKKKVSMISSIPMKCLDQVKEWLNSCDIRYTEGVQSLNWTKIMKTINDDPEGFFNSGGWSFLDPESDDEEMESESEESDEYQPSSDDNEGVEDEETDSDEDYTSISEGSDLDEEEEDSEEESGKDWDELEQEAIQADQERVRYDENEETSRSRKRTTATKHSSSNGRPSKKRKR